MRYDVSKVYQNHYQLDLAQQYRRVVPREKKQV